jgi:cold shock CspA family protein
MMTSDLDLATEEGMTGCNQLHGPKPGCHNIGVHMEDWKLGRVKKWFEDQGFGFICFENDRNDAFLHISVIPMELRNDIQVDVIVEVKVEQAEKGLKVVEIQTI